MSLADLGHRALALLRPPPVPAPVERAPTAPIGYNLPVSGGFIPASWPINYWQLGYDPLPSGRSAVVYACISAYSQTIAMCPGTHWQSDGNGGRARVPTVSSALSRFLQKPNGYQSPVDFFLYLTDCLYGEGEAVGLALRNQRFEIQEIHLMDPRRCWPRVAQNGELFYSLAGNEIVDRLFAGNSALLNAVPARDVLHVRLPDPRNPLRGVPPLTAAYPEIAASYAMTTQDIAFASNQSRPSGVLETDLTEMSEDDIKLLRQRWNDQTQGANQGGTPILTHGMKWKPAIINARDAQIAEKAQMSDARIATAYRVPQALLSLNVTPGPQASTESLMQFWVGTGLGFAAALIEDAVGRVFGLKGQPDDYLELDFEALLRANFKDRMEGLARAVQGGIFAPNEARGREELPKVAFGDEPRVQQQVVPLSAWAQTPPATPAPNAPPSPPPAGADPNAGDGSERDFAKRILDAADRLDRRAA